MKKNAAGRPVPVGESDRKAASSTVPAVTVPELPAHAALLELAEEFGRLVARELARPGRRRGFSLAELLIGGSIMALVLVLVVRA